MINIELKVTTRPTANIVEKIEIVRKVDKYPYPQQFEITYDEAIELMNAIKYLERSVQSDELIIKGEEELGD